MASTCELWWYISYLPFISSYNLRYNLSNKVTKLGNHGIIPHLVLLTRFSTTPMPYFTFQSLTRVIRSPGSTPALQVNIRQTFTKVQVAIKWRMSINVINVDSKLIWWSHLLIFYLTSVLRKLFQVFKSVKEGGSWQSINNQLEITPLWSFKLYTVPEQ